MARIFQAGAEVDAGSPVGGAESPDGLAFGGVPTRDTSVFRSGVASWSCDSTGANVATRLGTTFTGAATSYFARIYVRLVAAPTTTARIFTLDSGASAQCRTDGALELIVSNVVQGSPSAVITDSAWHRVELSGTATGTAWTAHELVVDGISVSTWSGSRIQSANIVVLWGWAGAPGASLVINVDDIAVNDATGAANNGYPGDGSVVLLAPTADSAVGTGWTLGTGTAIAGNSGKTAVSNTPPLGVADLAAGSDVKQIRNATSNANTNYDATMATYTAAGIGGSAVINAVAPWVATAAPVTTSAKAGTVGVVSNPAIANVNLAAAGTAGAFWSGATAGAYATGWKWSRGTIAQAPSVTNGTAPVMRITQVTASTRIAMVCGMFVYVDYTPGAVAAAPIPDVGVALTVT